MFEDLSDPFMSKDNNPNPPGEKNPPPTNNAAVHMVTATIFVLILLISLFSAPGTGIGMAKMLAGIINLIFEVFGHVR